MTLRSRRGRARSCPLPRRPPPAHRTLAGLAGLLAVAGGAERSARADTPITKNDFALEFYQGPIIAPNTVESIAGAYTAVAEGVDGAAVNAASPAVREPFSLKWVDYDFDIGLSFPGAYANTDFDNSGKLDSANNFLYFNVGAKVQLGSFGTSVTGEFLRYTIPSSTSSSSLSLTAGRWHALVGYGIWDNQLVVGAGLRAVSMQLSESAAGGGGSSITSLPSNLPNPTGSSLLTMTGVAPEAGFLIKPNDLPFRIGATVRLPVTGTTFGGSQANVDSQGVTRVGSVILPSNIYLPWEVEAGFAIQVGPRPLNPAWINPHDQDAPVRTYVAAERARRAREQAAVLAETPPAERVARLADLEREEVAIRIVEEQRMEAEERALLAERKARYANWPRERILVLASLLMTGPSSNAVSLEGFLNQVHDQYGQAVTLSPRLGIESEPIANLIHGRIGSYLEPSLFEDGHLRQHFTFGGDLKLLPFDTFGLTKDQVWRVSVAVDLAPRYINYGFSLGAWH